ncbi:recombinase family protein [Streptomyces sp. SLBN-115]|uniref:recombinase family protein n=1 Tax=Streptomyces sp. SLBN-115 TaxID=2768453 RepID=UPI001151A790|nr:recombinase family protein [Streptomyces sp. SLBN-115]TQJ56010.1 DNA invertase Pin-like site-specific DNA recombinase [Streptomyces sp. SLBN-115]
MARVLGIIRLSRDTDDSTSVARQRQYITTWADQNGHVIVGWAEDVDVSGGIAPWQRPELGKWLPSTIGTDSNEEAKRRAWQESRARDFDVMAVWRLDRISRRVIHLNNLIEWCEEVGKTLQSTSEGFDIQSPMGRVFVNILAALAEGELEAIKERAKSSFSHLMRKGRWRGGFVPYGYRPVKGESGDGWRLEVDPETAETMRTVVRNIIGGDSANSQCRWLNEKKVPTPLDAQRIRAGKDSQNREWRVGNLIKMLHSHTLLGQAEMTETYMTPNGKKETVTRLVRGEDGLPLQRAEAIISGEEFKQLQAALSGNSKKQNGNRIGGSPLLRVAYCGVCREPLYRNRGRYGMYYRCGKRARAGVSCTLLGIKADELEATVEESFLSMVGDLEIVRKVLVPGIDHSAELADVQRAMKELMEDRRAGLYSSESGTKEFRQMYKRLEDQENALKALPAREDEWIEEPTGETYRDRWGRLPSHKERNKELRDAGVRAVVHAEETQMMPLFDLPGLEPVKGSRVSIVIPSDLKERVLKASGL